jgi:hypothetical protein
MKQRAQQLGETKNNKKLIPSCWTFSILSSKEMESSLNNKTILWRTLEKQICRLGVLENNINHILESHLIA